jgi:hypothetical protein
MLSTHDMVKLKPNLTGCNDVSEQARLAPAEERKKKKQFKQIFCHLNLGITFKAYCTSFTAEFDIEFP